MSTAISLLSTPLKNKYNEYMYLGAYYRWSAKKGFGATGSRSPLGGQPYKTNSDRAHHLAHIAADKVMSKIYFQQAADVRKQIEKIFSK